jgi:hypothetical protein
VGNILVFARAKDFAISGSETPIILDANKPLIARVKELRGKVAEMVGMCKDCSKVDVESPTIPIVMLVSPATVFKGHLLLRLILDDRCHTSMAGSGGICTAACSRVPGSVVNQLLDATGLEEKTFNIQHPLGIMPIFVETELPNRNGDSAPRLKTLSFVGTARRILKGSLSVPDDIQDVFPKEPLVNGLGVNGTSVKVANGLGVNGDQKKALNVGNGNIYVSYKGLSLRPRKQYRMDVLTGIRAAIGINCKACRGNLYMHLPLCP